MATPKLPFAASLTIHAGAAVLLFTMVSVHVKPTPIRPRPIPLIDPTSYHRALKFRSIDPGGGGGGAGSPLPVRKGRLPKQSPRPFAPPMILTETRQAPLLVEPALLTQNDSPVNFPMWGDPSSKSLLPSNGPGGPDGMGSGKKGGVGPDIGPGYGPGPELGSGDPRLSRSGVTAPRVIYQIDPEFSEEARRAKHYGAVILVVDVDTTGRAVNIRIAKSLGLGLDEKAVEAISRWRFRPGMRNGKAVILPATIEVNFHLL